MTPPLPWAGSGAWLDHDAYRPHRDMSAGEFFFMTIARG
jgi:hypothetical protein